MIILIRPMRALGKSLVFTGLIALVSFPACAQFTAEEWLAGPRQPVEDLGGAVQANPDDFTSLMALGIVLLEDGSHQDAAKTFERAATINPQSSPAHLFLALSYGNAPIVFPVRTAMPKQPWPKADQERFYALADKAFATAARLNDADRFLWLAWASSLFGRSRNNPLLLPIADPSPALEKIRKSLEIDPDYKAAQMALASVLYSYAGLLSHFERYPTRETPAWVSGDLTETIQVFADEAIVIIWELLGDEAVAKKVHGKLLELLLWSKRFDDALLLCKEYVAPIENAPIENKVHRARFVEIWTRYLKELDRTQKQMEIRDDLLEKHDDCINFLK